MNNLIKYGFLFLALYVMVYTLMWKPIFCPHCKQLESKLIKANNTIDSINIALQDAIIIYKEK